MSKLHLFKHCIRERLTTAALGIFEAVEKTFSEFQQEMCLSRKESARLKRLLSIVCPPGINIPPADVQHLSLPEPQPKIKEEQELWTNQEEEQLQGLQAETTDPRFTEESKILNIKMSELNALRELFGEILTTAALDIYCAAEKPLAGYEEEICHSEEERKRLQRLLDVFTQPEIKLHRTEVQHPSLLKPLIKEEQLQRLQAKTTDSSFTSLSVDYDSENTEEDSLPSNTSEEQIEAEPHVQDCAAPEPVSDSQPLSVVAPDCPERLEEHGGKMLLQNKTQNKKAIPRNDGPQRDRTGKRIHQCQECNKTFGHKCDLVDHMKNHTGEKPYQCPKCSKRFSYKHSLNGHIRTHTGEKRFQCQECKKEFVWRYLLVRHMKTHKEHGPV